MQKYGSGLGRCEGRKIWGWIGICRDGKIREWIGGADAGKGIGRRKNQRKNQRGDVERRIHRVMGKANREVSGQSEMAVLFWGYIVKLFHDMICQDKKIWAGHGLRPSINWL
ncbi:hypothetical protein MCJ35_30215 [Enterocloster sp. OA13]|uniref:hypothetical protein n=1 Tax=Enterocloster sp. OA13 TaxID=2914161 RepID=UPI00046ED824|nr:hypothetical protein [Enterocloster sp. OA13]